MQEETGLRVLQHDQLSILVGCSVFDGVELCMWNGELGCSLERLFIQLPLGIDADVPRKHQLVEVCAVDHAGPTLQFLVVWVGRLDSRLSDMLAEAHMPCSPERSFAEPFQSLRGRDVFSFFQRGGWRREVAHFDVLREDAEHLGQKPSLIGFIFGEHELAFAEVFALCVCSRRPSVLLCDRVEFIDVLLVELLRRDE